MARTQYETLAELAALARARYPGSPFAAIVEACAADALRDLEATRAAAVAAGDEESVRWFDAEAATDNNP